MPDSEDQFLYSDLCVYPTRIGVNHVLFSWNADLSSIPVVRPATASQYSTTDIVRQMYLNSKMWHMANISGRETLEQNNVDLANYLITHRGLNVWKDGNGVWYENADRLFNKYNIYDYADKYRHKVCLYLTHANGDDIFPNDNCWDFNYDNIDLFSDSMVSNQIFDISPEATNGDLYECWVPEGYTVVSLLILYHWNDDLDCDTVESVAYYYYNSGGSNLITNAAPTLSYNNGILTIGELAPGRRVLEFRCKDIDYGGASGIKDEDTLNEMLYTTSINMERSNPYIAYYDLPNAKKLARWSPGTYTVVANFRSTENKSVIDRAINTAIYQINSVLGNYGITFVRDYGSTHGDMTIMVDSEAALFPNQIDSGYYYGGTWERTVNSDGAIIGAVVKLANDFQEYARFSSYETIAFEEMMQCLGAGFDQVEYPHDTIHTDFCYYNRSSTMYERDEYILKLLYWDQLSPNDDYLAISKKLNIPKGCYMHSTAEEDTEMDIPTSAFLDPGKTYEVRAFIVNSYGNVTLTSDWLTIITPESQQIYTHFDWDWSGLSPYTWERESGSQKKTGYGVYIHRDEWNRLVEYVNAVCGTAISKVTSSNVKISANLVRPVAQALGVTPPSQGDTITASFFNALRAAYNNKIS